MNLKQYHNRGEITTKSRIRCICAACGIVIVFTEPIYVIFLYRNFNDIDLFTIFLSVPYYSINPIRYSPLCALIIQYDRKSVRSNGLYEFRYVFEIWYCITPRSQLHFMLSSSALNIVRFTCKWKLFVRVRAFGYMIPVFILHFGFSFFFFMLSTNGICTFDMATIEKPLPTKIYWLHLNQIIFNVAIPFQFDDIINC